MCSESLGSEKVSYGPCAHQESCESLAAMAKFLVIRFDRSTIDVGNEGGKNLKPQPKHFHSPCPKCEPLQ